MSKNIKTTTPAPGTQSKLQFGPPQTAKSTAPVSEANTAKASKRKRSDPTPVVESKSSQVTTISRILRSDSKPQATDTKEEQKEPGPTEDILIIREEDDDYSGLFKPDAKQVTQTEVSQRGIGELIQTLSQNSGKHNHNLNKLFPIARRQTRSMPAIPLQTALADIEAEPIPKQFSIKVHCMMYSLQYLARNGAFKETVAPQILHWTDCR